MAIWWSGKDDGSDQHHVEDWTSNLEEISSRIDGLYQVLLQSSESASCPKKAARPGEPA